MDKAKEANESQFSKTTESEEHVDNLGDEAAKNHDNGDVSKVETGDGEKNPENEKDECSPHKHNNGCCGFYFPRRYLTSLLAGLGMLLVYAMRTNIGMTAITLLDERSPEKVGTVEAIINLPTASWTTRKVALLHSSFYLGYIVTHIPAGYLTVVWPCNRIYGTCILISAMLNLTLPYSMENLHYWVSCLVRFSQGLSEGLLYPSCYGVLRHWSTPSERGRIVSAVLTGCYAGAIVGFPLAGFITHYLAWQYVYYVSGGACAAWYVLWMCVVSEKPSHDDRISDEELDFLTTSQGSSALDYENIKIPWTNILTSFPVIALCICHFSRNWVFVLMLTNEPYFLNNFGFSLAENGVYSSIPHIAKVLAAFLSGFIADCIITGKLLSTTALRKLLTTVGYGGQAVCFVVLTFFSAPMLVLTFLTLGIGLFGLSVSGWQINHYDLATRYAGVLVGITSTSGALAAIAVPIVAGELTLTNARSGWNMLFYITVGILLFSVVFYLIFGSGEEQRWAHPPPTVQLVQKDDPMARKPYRIRVQQRASSALPIPEDLAGKLNISHTEHSRLVERSSENISPKYGDSKL